MRRVVDRFVERYELSVPLELFGVCAVFEMDLGLSNRVSECKRQLRWVVLVEG